MPSVNLSEAVRVEVIRPTTAEGKFSGGAIIHEFDRIWFHLLNKDATELQAGVHAVTDYMKDFGKCCLVLSQNNLKISSVCLFQLAAFAHCVAKISGTFDAIDSAFEREEIHLGIKNLQSLADIVAGRLEKIAAPNEERNFFYGMGLPKMFYYEVLQSEEIMREFAGLPQVSDIQLYPVYVHLRDVIGVESLRLTMMRAARAWVGEMEAQAIRELIIRRLFQDLMSGALNAGGEGGPAGAQGGQPGATGN